jgi:hypothetical protein
MEVVLKKPAQKFIEKQPKNIIKKIDKVIKEIESIDTYDNFKKSNINYRKVESKFYNRYQLYRIRIDTIRLIFHFKDDKLCIVIINAGNRGDIYKKL